MKLFLHQLRGEQKLYWRSRELAFFTFLFPIVIFVLLDSVYGKKDVVKGEHLKASAYLLAGVLGYGIASTAFAGLAIVLVLRRENGILKRLRGTPLPPATYLAGVIVSTVLVYAIEAVALILIGRLGYHIPLHTHWLSLVLALLLGTLSFAALGIALTSVIRSGNGASAVVNIVYLPASFLSGSFWPTENYPHFLQVIADALPLTYFIRLMRDVALRHHELWTNWIDVAVVGGWGLAGLVVAIRYFRWEPREG